MVVGRSASRTQVHGPFLLSPVPLRRKILQRIAKLVAYYP